MKDWYRGNASSGIFIVIILLGLLGGGLLLSTYHPVTPNPGLATPTPKQTASGNALQMFGYKPPTPTPTSVQNTPNPSLPTTSSSPYGFTTVNADTTLISEYKQLQVTWVRYQVIAQNIDWNKLDGVIAQLNAAGIHIDFSIHCLTGNCFSNPPQPTVNQVSAFASQIASRYNGKNGHGYIDAYEIGNEEYDFYPTTVYPPYLKAGCQAIKSASPNALCGMYGTYKPDLTHYTAVVSDIFTAGDGPYMDFMNFHYYVRGQNPANPGSGMSAFTSVWQSMKTTATQNGFPNMPIWVTETGWPTTPVSCCSAVTPATQSQYLQYIMDNARNSHAVQRVFWFTINYGNQGDTIYPPSGPLPAFTTYRSYIQQYPLW